MRTLSGTVVPSLCHLPSVSPRLFSSDLASSFFSVAACAFCGLLPLAVFHFFPFFAPLLRFALLVALFPEHHLELVAALSSL